MNIKQKRAAALASAKALVEAAKSGQRELTEDEMTEYQGYVTEIKGYDAQIEAAAKSGPSLLAELDSLAPKDGGTDEQQRKSPEAGPRSLGEHFVKHAGARLAEIKGVRGASVAVPEWTGPAKAATDTQTVGSVFQTPVLTQFDRTIVQAVRPRLVLADLLGAGTISGNAISYFVEGALEGSFATVAETGQKPQLHVGDPTTEVDMLKKIAGFTKFSDEMLEDLDFVVSEINNRLLYELARFEEIQLLRGDGTGQNILGLLNREGIQSLARTAGEPEQDAIFRAITAVQTGSGLDADGIVIHPLDYQRLRLSRDANGQYFGGGFFTGQYGQGGILEQPPLWGLRTVVTPAATQGQAVVAAFNQAATVYRKGGVRVESTNSHANDFTTNLVTVRAEERVALAVRRPAGVATVALAEVV